MKYCKIKIGVLFLVWTIPHVLHAQQAVNKKEQIDNGAYAERGPNNCPDIITAKMVGAPKLSKPQLILGKDEKPLIANGHGIASPACYDFDNDGLQDLLIGEFGTGIENEQFVGNFLRFYKNTGSNSNPTFTGEYYYARPSQKVRTNGTPLSTEQFCCIGFTPQFIDLDQDGRMDIISGQYNGHVRWFRGVEGGFDEGRLLVQEGNPDDKDIKLKSSDNIRSQHYWLFSSASFGDFTNDGLPDMVTGGSSLRISKNVGTKEAPKFSKRELLLDINNNPLKIGEFLSEEEKKSILSYAELPIAGTGLLTPLVTDWNNDGIPDLLVTNNYTQKGMPAVTCFQGVKTDKGIRFQPGIALFSGVDSAKVFPGRWLRVNVTDWNNDGIKDLLIGAMVPTIYDQVFSSFLSWNWEKDTGLQKYTPGNLKSSPSTQEDWLQKYLDAPSITAKMNADDYRTLRHLGYVYVMLGEKSSK